MNLDKKFDHKITQEGRYQKWLEQDLFTADLDTKKETYTIVLPPPNVTGKLHLGHAWDVTLQDLLIRYKKMNGFETMWIAGMDHAGIATQAKVDARLKDMGINRFEIGKERFLEYAYDWKSEYASHIREQWASMGIALDYSQERFTLDPDVNKSVNKVFVQLYNEGLIYQGYRITNWDPVAKTALSDIEVIHKEVEGKFYHFKYLLEDDSNSYLEVATTRPETIFADGAVAVNPEDERYKHLIGKNVINPADKRVLKVIGDEIAQMDFGSGAVKISGAHDPNDYEVCNRHPEIEKPIVMNLDGTMNELCLEFNGMDRFEVRKKLVQKLDEEGLLIKIEEHVHNVGHSERTNAIVEPMLTKQWYVKMEQLANQAIENQNSETKVNFYPQRFNDTFVKWMENVHDWCISRQLWWGHQIPVWYHNTTGEIYCSETAPKDIENYTRDQDVLDTWFSSALWPFTTTIWADKPKEIEKFFPTDVLVTGYDIIFFWVSRMIFQSLHFTKEVPFKDTLIHGLIRDEEGRKMSKSLGNGVDPQDVVRDYGTDSLRLFLTTNSSPGQDLRYSTTKLESSWNFLNKIWNISRFVLMNSENIKLVDNISEYEKDFDSADYYIISRLNETVEYARTMIEKYEFGEAARKIHSFAWDDFAAWYVEISKINLNGENESLKLKQQVVLKYVLDKILKMLHPFTPFITDMIYEELSDTPIVLTEYPSVIKLENDLSQEFKDVISLITAIRNMRSEQDIKSSKMLSIVIEREEYSSEMQQIIHNIGKVENISYNTSISDGDFISVVLQGQSLHINTEGLIDIEAKIEQLNGQLNKVKGEIKRSFNMLNNEKFISNAKEDKIKVEKDKASTYLEQYSETVELLKDLEINVENFEEFEKLNTIVKEI